MIIISFTVDSSNSYNRMYIGALNSVQNRFIEINDFRTNRCIHIQYHLRTIVPFLCGVHIVSPSILIGFLFH